MPTRSYLNSFARTLRSVQGMVQTAKSDLPLDRVPAGVLARAALLRAGLFEDAMSRQDTSTIGIAFRYAVRDPLTGPNKISWIECSITMRATPAVYWYPFQAVVNLPRNKPLLAVACLNSTVNWAALGAVGWQLRRYLPEFLSKKPVPEGGKVISDPARPLSDYD